LKYAVGIILLITTLQIFAVEPNVVKDPVSFSHFWGKSEDLRSKYSCNFHKVNNPYFEFMFAVLDIESNDQEEIENTGILSTYSNKLISEKLLSKTVVKNTFSDILCITDSSAFVLNRMILRVKPDGYAFGVTSVVKYEYALENSLIKLKIHEGKSVDWYHMSETIDAHIFYKIKFEQAVPIAE
jgi:hypothetical protein